jgi:superfamily II DNA or RNA helicase
MCGTMFEAIVVGATIPELILGGHLVDVEIYAPSEPDLIGVKVVAGDYEEKGLAEAVDKPKLIGDIVAHYIKLAMGKRAIVFATNVAHSQHIVQTFQEQGIDARHVDGYMNEEERRPLIDAFKRGDFPILSNCSLLAEGFDCPETEVIILARPTKSLIRYIQMAGRALRPHHSKESALILDHSGTVRRLGFPTDDLPLMLDDGKPKEKKESENLPKVCKSCFAVYPRGVKVCPCCGFEPVMTPQEIAQEAGELQKLEKKRQKAISKEDKQGIYSALYAVRERKNYAKGWVSHNYRDITGVWPTGMKEVAGPMLEIVENHLTHKAIKFAKSPDTPKKTPLNHCPKCGAADWEDKPGSGPHKAGRKCNKCNCFWWVSA